MFMLTGAAASAARKWLSDHPKYDPEGEIFQLLENGDVRVINDHPGADWPICEGCGEPYFDWIDEVWLDHQCVDCNLKIPVT